jgi:Rps23 Pro-64 3,4-dihydroxylase Tpa1-like proline 4-hydroxylase
MCEKELVEAISDKLGKNSERLMEQYENSKTFVGVKFFFLDNLLPVELTNQIYESFEIENQAWRLMSSFREKKYTSKEFKSFPSLLADITFALQSKEVISRVEEITGITEMHGDPTLYAGGLSMMKKGHFLNPHIDNSHDQNRSSYRRLNILFYVTPGWEESYGGHLQLWDKKVINSKTIQSKFNRLVVMETNPWSWHSVSEVKGNGVRCCVSNYFFSLEAPTEEELFHVTSFQAIPEKKLMRFVCSVDNKLRLLARSLKKDGFGKKDIYREK